MEIKSLNKERMVVVDGKELKRVIKERAERVRVCVCVCVCWGGGGLEGRSTHPYKRIVYNILHSSMSLRPRNIWDIRSPSNRRHRFQDSRFL